MARRDVSVRRSWHAGRTDLRAATLGCPTSRPALPRARSQRASGGAAHAPARARDRRHCASARPDSDFPSSSGRSPRRSGIRHALKHPAPAPRSRIRPWARLTSPVPGRSGHKIWRRRQPPDRTRGTLSSHLALGRLAPSKLQFSTAEHHLVAILELVELIASEPPAAGDVGAVEAPKIADEILRAVLDDLGMAARHAIGDALELAEIDIGLLPAERAADNRAALYQPETPRAAARG